MLKVTIEMLPRGREEGKRVMGVAYITNDLVGSIQSAGQTGSYDVTLSKWAPKQGQVWKRGRVESFDRERRGPWDLLYLALRNIVGERNG